MQQSVRRSQSVRSTSTQPAVPRMTDGCAKVLLTLCRACEQGKVASGLCVRDGITARRAQPWCDSVFLVPAGVSSWVTPFAEAPVRRCSRSDSASSGIVGFPRPSAAKGIYSITSLSC